MQRICLAALCLATLSAATPALAQQLYWISADGVQRAGLDGTGLQTIVPFTRDPGGGRHLASLAIDVPAHRLYYSIYDVSGNGAIERAALDGSGGQPIFSNVRWAEGLAIDSAGGHLYWGGANPANLDEDVINRSPLGGGDSSVFFPNQDVSKLALDPAHNTLYQLDLDDNGVLRLPLDGSGGGPNFDFAGPEEVNAFAFDPVANRTLLVEAGYNDIWSADLQGAVQRVFYTLSNPNEARIGDIAVDPLTGDVYWSETDYFGGAIIRRARGNGTNVQTVLSGLAGAGALTFDLYTPTPGDANIDGTVDFTDLGIILNHFNQPGTASDGDADGSGTVDFADLGLLLNNYSQPAPVLGSAAAVPEPSSLVLLAGGAMGLFLAARRKLTS